MPRLGGIRTDGNLGKRMASILGVEGSSLFASRVAQMVHYRDKVAEAGPSVKALSLMDLKSSELRNMCIDPVLTHIDGTIAPQYRPRA